MRGDWRRTLSPGDALSEERIHVDNPNTDEVLGQALLRYVSPLVAAGEPIIVMCIGTDRSIGDALGPLVGTYLAESCPPDVRVYGTLEQPVHAGNLAETLEGIRGEHRNPFIIAVDACLGRPESVGMLTIGRGSLKPGAGVNKALPEVGQVYITGVVNVGGFMEYFVLQNTRLAFVVRLAKAVAKGLRYGLSALHQQHSNSVCVAVDQTARPG